MPMWASWLPQRRRLQLLQCPWRAVATRRDWRSRSTLAPAASFPAMGLHASLLDALEKQGIAAPSPIQAAAIPPVAHGRSCAVQSHTGSGKTLAYLLPILSGALGRMHRAAAGGGRLPAKEHLHALVVTPSKDLALQVAQVARELLPREQRDLVQPVIGGVGLTRQVAALRKGRPLLVVGTPGRLAELGRTGKLPLDRCPVVVLDEADEFLGMPLAAEAEQLNRLVGCRLPAGAPPRQVVLVSASMRPALLPRFAAWCDQAAFIQAPAADSPGVTTGVEVAAAPALGTGATLLEPEVAAAGATPSAGDAPLAAPQPELSSVAHRLSASSSKQEHGPDDAAVTSSSSNSSSSSSSSSNSSSSSSAATSAAPQVLPPNLRHLYVRATASAAPPSASGLQQPLQPQLAKALACVHALALDTALVFVDSRDALQKLMTTQYGRRADVAALHGGMAPQARSAALRGFRSGAVRVLLVSNAAARGLDVPDCDAVFLLQPPPATGGGWEQYAHRAGRAGRMGRLGLVITVVQDESERRRLSHLGRQIGVSIDEVIMTQGGKLRLAASLTLPSLAALAASSPGDALAANAAASGSTLPGSTPTARAESPPPLSPLDCSIPEERDSDDDEEQQEEVKEEEGASLLDNSVAAEYGFSSGGELLRALFGTPSAELAHLWERERLQRSQWQRAAAPMAEPVVSDPNRLPTTRSTAPGAPLKTRSAGYDGGDVSSGPDSGFQDQQQPMVQTRGRRKRRSLAALALGMTQAEEGADEQAAEAPVEYAAPLAADAHQGGSGSLTIVSSSPDAAAAAYEYGSSESYGRQSSLPTITPGLEPFGAAAAATATATATAAAAAFGRASSSAVGSQQQPWEEEDALYGGGQRQARQTTGSGGTGGGKGSAKHVSTAERIARYRMRIGSTASGGGGGGGGETAPLPSSSGRGDDDQLAAIRGPQKAGLGSATDSLGGAWREPSFWRHHRQRQPQDAYGGQLGDYASVDEDYDAQAAAAADGAGSYSSRVDTGSLMRAERRRKKLERTVLRMASKGFTLAEDYN